MTVHPPPSERSFGLSLGGASLGISAIAWWGGHDAATSAAAAAGVVLTVAAIIAPAALRLPNRWWWRFAQALGYVNARVLLAVFFVLVLTPVGCTIRLLGRNPLRARRAATSGWLPYTDRRRNPAHFERLF